MLFRPKGVSLLQAARTRYQRKPSNTPVPPGPSRSTNVSHSTETAIASALRVAALADNITTAEMQSRASLILGQFQDAGYVSNGAMVLLPRATGSTDSYTTEANQTVLANWDTGGPPDLYSQSILSLGFDFELPMDSVRGVNPFRWKVNGTANYYTSDGIHPSGNGAIAMGTECATIMAAEA